jgi:hypothetical protein
MRDGLQVSLAEGDVVMVLPELLSATAFMEYTKASNQTPAAIYSYCSAMQWFLSTFASKEAFSDAVLSLGNLRQSPNLSVEVFANLIQRDARKLCGVVPEREQKRIFRKGLLPSCRLMVEALARHDDVPWATLMRVALAGETSVSSNQSRLSGERRAALTLTNAQRAASMNMTRWRQPVQDQPAAMSGTDGGALPATLGGQEELTFTDRVAASTTMRLTCTRSRRVRRSRTRPRAIRLLLVRKTGPLHREVSVGV